MRDRIAYVSFERREKHNAFRDEDLQALTAAVRRLDADDTADIAILFGQGKSFSSGGDVGARLQRSMDEGSTAGRTTEREAFLECDHWKPVIAAVHGYCLGHALATALLCDHVVASPDARFQVTETRIGLAMPGLIPQLGTPAFAYDVALTGRMFTAEEAMAGGMLTRLVGDGGHIDGAEELARQILENPQTAVRSLVQVRRTMIGAESARYKAVAPAFDWATSSEARAAVAARAAGARSDGGGHTVASGPDRRSRRPVDVDRPPRRRVDTTGRRGTCAVAHTQDTFWAMPDEPSQEVVVDRTGAIVTVRINRPDARNAMNVAVMAGIGGALRDAEGDEEVRAVVLTGTGDRAFCAGMDLRAFAEGGMTPSDDQEVAMEAFSTFIRGGFSTPVIGAANASAVAGGFELLMACDLIVASEEARFGIPEAKRGLFAAGGGVFLPRRIPLAIALELGMTGDDDRRRARRRSSAW